MNSAAHIDFETRSAVDLRKSGVHRYALDASTWVWVMSWRIGNTGPVHRWRPGEADPVALLDHIRQGGRVVAHNAVFERTIWNWLIIPRIAPHWPPLPVEQMSCTMSRAAALGIPQGLDFAAQVLGSPNRKDVDGSHVMMKMARPRKRIEGTIKGAEIYIWWDADAALRAKLEDYCDQDVITETGIDERAAELTPSERAVWLLDQHINDRGVRLDVATINRALDLVDYTKKALDREMIAVTGGAVRTCGQLKKLVEWINAQGVACESLAKDKQAEILEDADEQHDEMLQLLGNEGEWPNPVRRAVELRQQASKSSTAKLKAMLNCVCADSRARGLLHYHGAGTGRWAGRLIQPQNLYRTDPDRDGESIRLTINLLNTLPPAAAHEMIEALIGPVLPALAKIMRSMFVAEPGKRFIGADLANIEGRLQAWFGNEHWKLDAFRAFDAKRGPDLYCVAYGRAFGEDPVEVKKQSWKRQIGKVMELALGYQGGVGSFISMGKVYGLKPAGLVEPVRAAVPASTWEAQAAKYRKAPDKYGLNQDEWTAIKIIVAGWRAAHPGIVQGWWDLQDAAIEAVGNPGVIVPVFGGKVRYLSAGGFLWCSLPNNRCIAYCQPRIVTVREEVERDDGTTFERIKRRVDYDGYDGEKKKWSSFSLYGGLQFNNVVQGTARDVLVGGMMRAETAGYAMVLTVHDENLTEVPNGYGSADELERLMTQGEPWLQGCPLAAKGWEDVRYAK